MWKDAQVFLWEALIKEERDEAKGRAWAVIRRAARSRCILFQMAQVTFSVLSSRGFGDRLFLAGYASQQELPVTFMAFFMLQNELPSPQMFEPPA